MKRWIPSLNVLAIASLGVCQGIAQTVPSAPAATGNDYTFDVSTTQPWTDTGVDLQTGDVLEISASGAKICDPQGVSGASAQGLPVSSALPGALIAKLQAQAVPVLVGSSQEVKVDAPGHLFLGINTGEKPPCKGSFAVKVHRQEQAESNRGTVLKQQLASAAETFLAGQFGVQPGGSANAAVTPALKISDAPLDAGLRKDIDGLPRRVNDQFKNLGDMVNFILIGSQQQVQAALDAANFHIADTDNKKAVLDTTQAKPIFSSGAIPPPTRALDRSVLFVTSVPVTDWGNGENANPIGITVQTRISKLYERLFEAQGDFAPTVEFFLLFAVIIFAIIELLAIWIGTQLTRTVTGAVAQLYEGTQLVNRGDFSHRIPVKSSDQVATLATSFNAMTASLEKLIEEQKDKQRLENELVIAREVQAQLFPHDSVQLASLEVHGFFRPARTVSGDYYDFLALDSDRLILAVGDISGKGISAALLMATIHSAVRAYSLQDIPVLREPAAVGAALSSDVMLASGLHGVDVSPAALLSLLNHQLYESTPPEKYATLFLGIYDGAKRKLTYSNGGHLPPIIMSQDGSIRRLECGGTVVGLFDSRSYEEGSVELRRGELLLAYTDGVTEPENDFGEFGERRLIDLLRENRDLPLPRISEIVTAAVDDWIGANEQPDDITLVLARAR